MSDLLKHREARNAVFLLILIVILGGVARGYVLFNTPQTNSDGVLYAWIAGNMADGYGYTIAKGTSLSDSRMWHVPAYPMVMALFFRILGKGLLISRLPSLIFGVLIILLTYKLAVLMFNEKAGLLAALIAALHPTLIATSATAMAESMYILLLLLFLYELLRPGKGMGPLHSLRIGLIAGGAYLTRTVGVITVPVYLVHIFRSKDETLKGSSAAFLLGFSLLALPWWIWSSHSYGTPFSAEQNTLIQMYQFEFGQYTGQGLSLPMYLSGLHTPLDLVGGYADGLSKLLKAALFPGTSFIGHGGNPNWLQAIFLTMLVIIIASGFREAVKPGRKGILELGAALILGALGYAWGVHIIPPGSATIIRYTAPLIPIGIIFFAAGASRLLEGSNRSKAFTVLMITAVTLFSISLTFDNMEFSRVQNRVFYRLAVENISHDSPILASDPAVLIELGFNEVHPLGTLDFEGMHSEIDKKGIEFIVIDSKSIYNDDQLYLVNYWYRTRIPDRLEKTGGDLFPISIYRVK